MHPDGPRHGQGGEGDGGIASTAQDGVGVQEVPAQTKELLIVMTITRCVRDGVDHTLFNSWVIKRD